MSNYYLYHTLGCHLCDDAESLLNTIKLEFKTLDYEKVDIATNDDLVDKYGVRIPVILHAESGVELNWPFDTVSLRQFVAATAIS